MATVPAPPLRPPAYSLIIAARNGNAATDANVRTFDRFDLRWQPEACTSIGPLAPCDVTTELTLPDDCGDIDDAQFRSIDLWAGYRTSTFGDWFPEADAKARAALAATESYQLAGEVWEGTLAIAGGYPNSYFRKTGDFTVISGGVRGVPEVVGVVDAELGDCLNGARGMFHVTPLVLAQLVASQAVRLAGNLWVTPMGNVVVTDAGYTGTAAAGQSSVGGNEWGFATGWVDVHLGEVRVIADESTIDRRQNTIEVRAFRAAAAVWDPCCRLAVQIDPCSSPCAN